MGEKLGYDPGVEGYIFNLRRNLDKVPVLAFCDSGVPSSFIESGWEEVERVMEIFGGKNKRMLFGARSWREGGYSSVDWYVDVVGKYQKRTTSDDYGDQLNLDRVFDLYEKGELLDKEKPSPHLRIMMVSRDVRGDEVGWGFGLTDGNLGLEVVSVKRFMEGKYSGEVGMKMWRRLVRHETGHLLGLVSRKTNVVESLGPHCLNVCCMRQGLEMGEWRQLAEEEETKGVVFCGECEAELRRNVNMEG